MLVEFILRLSLFLGNQSRNVVEEKAEIVLSERKKGQSCPMFVMLKVEWGMNHHKPPDS